MTGTSGKPNILLREARERGDKFYEPTWPCKRGHMSKRFTGSGACYECTKIINAANTKKYRNGPDGDAFRAKKAAELSRWLAKPENAGKRELYAQRDLEKFGKRLKRPIAARVDTTNYKAKKMGIEGRITVEEITNLMMQQDYKCKCCEETLKEDWTIDHRMPLSKGGSNWVDNTQLYCFSCNRRKWDMHPDDWEQLVDLEKQGIALSGK